jgi:hypothetical protein
MLEEGRKEGRKAGRKEGDEIPAAKRKLRKFRGNCCNGKKVKSGITREYADGRKGK